MKRRDRCAHDEFQKPLQIKWRVSICENQRKRHHGSYEETYPHREGTEERKKEGNETSETQRNPVYLKPQPICKSCRFLEIKLF